MRFGSLFSGIGGIDLGLERAGMECAWQVEIDPYRREVLARHWPDVRRYEDVRDCGAAKEPCQAREQQLGQLGPVDLICGGFPCQDVSTAGKRAGLRAERSGLFFEFARIVGELRSKWIVVENVPGLYSSNAGKDFDTVIRTLAELGYGLAWRVLDSQHFGVPQRRRRVFIVGYLGGPCPPAVLFEREGGEGDSQEGGKAGEGVADSFEGSTVGALQGRDWKGVGNQYVNEGKLVLEEDPDTEFGTYCDGPDKAFPLEAADEHHGRSSPRGDGADNLVAVSENQRAECRLTPYSRQLTAGGGKPGQGYPAVLSPPANPNRVRETTGLPRQLDSRRYAALGDAVTVNVAEWIGKRIMAVEL